MSLMNAGLPNQPEKQLSVGVPVGAYEFMPSPTPLITMADGSQWLREGLVLPSASYPAAARVEHLRAHLFTQSSFTPSGACSSIATNGAGVFVACFGSAQIHSSTDNGATWTARTIGWAFAVPVAVVWNGTRFIAVGCGNDTGPGTAVLYAATSTDGVTWTANTISSAFSSSVTAGTCDIAWNGSVLAVIIGNQPTNQSVWTSPTGLSGTWTARTLPGSVFAASGARISGGGLGFVISWNSASAYTSPDGTTWTARTLPATPGGLYPAIITATSAALLTNTVSSTNVCYTTDLATWTNITLSAEPNILQGPQFLTRGSSFWALYGADSNLYRTLDGINWTACVIGDAALTPPFTLVSPQQRRVCIGDSAIVQTAGSEAVRPAYAVSTLSASNAVGGPNGTKQSTLGRGMWRIK